MRERRGARMVLVADHPSLQLQPPFVFLGVFFTVLIQKGHLGEGKKAPCNLLYVMMVHDGQKTEVHFFMIIQNEGKWRKWTTQVYAD